MPWYDANQRVLPWRALPGYPPNPYYVWLSEIMLQQTTVATVKDYFRRFIDLWPSIENLAQASVDEVFHGWQGLGYYSRARNLHQCAKILVQDFKGILPLKESALLALPGIGPYTASAIAAIAYELPTVPVDGNVVRIISRLFALEKPLPALKNEVQELAATLVPSRRRGDFAQSLMDLGATVCRPRNPLCEICPLQKICNGRRRGIAAELPRPALKKIKPIRYGIIFWIENDRGEILLEKRPSKGLLAGLTGLPTSSWKEAPWVFEEAIQQAPQATGSWICLPIAIRHTFTHFHLVLRVIKGKATPLNSKGLWSSRENFKNYAFPTLMKKVIEAVPCEHNN